MSMQVTKVWWDGDKLMAEPISEFDVYKPEPKRPQNCGTSYCSCIECVMKPAQQEDPCPGCHKGGVCRTPKCGRLKLPVDHPFRSQRLAQQEPEQDRDRVAFERHWRKTRGEKKAVRELPRHPLQPQTYIQDSANRHWVTWQAAIRYIKRDAA